MNPGVLFEEFDHVWYNKLLKKDDLFISTGAQQLRQDGNHSVNRIRN